MPLRFRQSSPSYCICSIAELWLLLCCYESNLLTRESLKLFFLTQHVKQHHIRSSRHDDETHGIMYTKFIKDKTAQLHKPL